MKYIYQDESGVTHFKNYFEYLKSIQHKLPEALYKFAADQSRYELNNPLTTHDSWLLSISVTKKITIWKRIKEIYKYR